MSMTTETKSGKGCPNKYCHSGKTLIFGSREICPDCKGIGWIPAPGDALTAKEAKTLEPSENVEVLNGVRWEKACKSDFKFGSWKFRLAPAPEEEPAVKVKSAEFPPTNKAFYNQGYEDGIDYVLSLTPEQLAALKQERSGE